MIDVAFVCCQALKEYDSESREVMAHLAQQGLRCEQWAWDDETVDWSMAKTAVVRSTWNYIFTFDAFLRWLDKVNGVTHLLNPASMIRWNTDKHYLRALENAGVPIVPTHYVEAGESIDLAARLREWGALIIKPTVSNGATNTILVESDELESGRAHLVKFSDRTMMIQPMMHKIRTQGERSQLYFGGALSHVIDKVPSDGDFRVQEHLGGTYTRVEPRKSDLKLAQAALGALDSVPLYARIDCVDDNNGQPRLMEMELIEPDLYLRHAPDGLDRLCQALLRTLVK